MRILPPYTHSSRVPRLRHPRLSYSVLYSDLSCRPLPWTSKWCLSLTGSLFWFRCRLFRAHCHHKSLHTRHFIFSLLFGFCDPYLRLDMTLIFFHTACLQNVCLRRSRGAFSPERSVVKGHCMIVVSSHVISFPQALWPIFTARNHFLSIQKELSGNASSQYTASRAIGMTHHGRPVLSVEARLPVYDLKLPPTPSSLVILSVMCYKVVRAIAVGRVSRR